MEKPAPTVQEFLARLRRARAEWEDLLGRVPAAALTVPGAVGDWSAQDLVAHVTWHEREMVEVLRARALVGSELWNLATDQRNAAIWDQNRGRPLLTILLEAGRVHAELLAGLEGLVDEDLRDPARFSGMPDDWVSGEIIAQNSYEHYAQHGPGLRRWLESSAFVAGTPAGGAATVPPRGPLLRKVDCVRLYVADLAAGLAFYRDRLGHGLIWRSERAAGLRMPESEAEIVLQDEDPGPEVDLLVDSAEEAAARIVAAGGRVVVPPFDIAIGRAVVVEDPFGNRLVLLDMSKGPLQTDAEANVV